MKISSMVLARARARRRRMTLSESTAVFNPAEPAPGVLPEGVNFDLAMDSAVVDTAAWGSLAIYSGAYQQGLTFLGYPALAEMAQRPEFRRICEVVATEMTRKWIKLKAKSDAGDPDKLDELREEMRRLDVQGNFRKLAASDGFFGRAHLYLDLGSTDDKDELKKPIGNGRNTASEGKVEKGSLRRLRVVEPVWCYPSSYNSNNPLKPDWYHPNSWYVMGTEIHSSRLLTLVGREVPDLLKPAFSFGGLSLTQMAKPYVDNWIRTRQSVSDLISNYSTNGIKTDMTGASQVGGEELFTRADLYNALRDNSGLMLLDKETEEFFNISTPLGTLDALQAQSQEHMAAICGIPIVKLLGITPAGLNASSEGEIRVFYDWIMAYQEQLFWEPLNRVLGFIQLSLWGKIDPDITFEFEPLWSLDELQMATVEKTKADTHKVYVDAGVLDPAEVRAAIVADPDQPYGDIKPDDVPEPVLESENVKEPTAEGEGAPGAAGDR